VTAYLTTPPENVPVDWNQVEALINERKRQATLTADVPLERVFDLSVVEEINRELAK